MALSPSMEAVLSRSGIDIPRNTLAHWMIKCGELIQPLINLLDDTLLAYPVVHCDETPIQVLNEPDKQAASKSYMWVRAGGPPTQPIRLFHYADSRQGKEAAQGGKCRRHGSASALACGAIAVD